MKAIVVLTDLNGNTRSVPTRSFGYFRFDNVEAGRTYIFTVNNKRYTFEPQTVTVMDELTDLNFIAW